MAILVRTNGGNWVPADQKIFAKESHLQELLLKTPELIETIDGSRLILTNEAGLSGGTSADLVGVTSDGDILIIEAKLASNPEIRRKVIGQIFEYGARLWDIDYETFDGFFCKRLNKTVIELFSSSQPEFDDVQFRKTVEQNLKSGKFHLLIAVDEMNEELNNILSYITSCSKGLKLEALAVRLYECDGVQVLAPQRYGQIAIVSSDGESMTAKSTVESLIANSTSGEMREKMELIAAMWRDAGNFVFAAKVGLSLRIGFPAKVVTLFWATPNETWGLQPNFTSMEQNGMPSQILADLRKNLSAVPGVSPDKVLTGQIPIIKFSQLTVESTKELVKLMIDAAVRWKESLQT